MTMPDHPSLSIVIPVYNVEKYLPMCMESLLKTDGIGDTEILLIDDGSTDGSGKLVDRYADEHPNISALHKENEGPSAARNFGISKATGKYIFFCDSDDEVVPALLGRIVKMTETADCDLFLWDADIIIETGGILQKRKTGYYSHYGLPKTEQTYTGRDLLEQLLRKGGGFVATVWLGAYKKSFLVENDLLFEKGLIHEDEFWVPQVFLKASSVHYVPEKIYRYRMHKGSIMHPNTRDRSEHVASLMKIYPSLYKYYEDVLAGDPLLPLIEGNLTTRYLHMIYKFRICKYGYGKQIDKKLLWRTSRRLRQKLMVLGLYVYAR